MKFKDLTKEIKDQLAFNFRAKLIFLGIESTTGQVTDFLQEKEVYLAKLSGRDTIDVFYFNDSKEGDGEMIEEFKQSQLKSYCQEIMKGKWSRSSIGATNEMMKAGRTRAEAEMIWDAFIDAGFIIPTSQKDNHYYFNLETNDTKQNRK